MIPLQGTLETVVLREIYRDETAIGTLTRTQETIFVSDAKRALDKGIETVLVRTDTGLYHGHRDYRYNPTAQTGNLISTTIPNDVQKLEWLEPDKYILTGVFPWPGHWPNLNEINGLFDPGRMGRTIYIAISDKGGWINPYGFLSPLEGYENAVSAHNATNPARYSKAIFVSSRWQLSQLNTAIKFASMAPIEIEPKHPTQSDVMLNLAYLIRSAGHMLGLNGAYKTR